MLRQVDPFLRNVNPILDWLGLYKREIVSFFILDAAATQAVDRPAGSSIPIHYLRTANPLNPENLAAYPRRISSNRSNPYVEPGGYSRLPLKVFGEYLCTNNPVPTLQPGGETGTLPGSVGEVVPGIPEPVAALLPDQLRDQLQTAVFDNGTAPPCDEQAPLGRFLGQPGKYPRVGPAPER